MAVLNEQGRAGEREAYRERECVHRRAGAGGCFYDGVSYVRSLFSLRATAAAEFAKRVTSFYWADAAQIVVWLCDDCAAELPGIGNCHS
ncbi:MAG: hypothetical protein ACJ741_06195 [Pyrinomonadaceae bacterium]